MNYSNASTASTQCETHQGYINNSSSRVGKRKTLSFDEEFLNEETREPFLQFDFKLNESIWVTDSEESEV